METSALLPRVQSPTEGGTGAAKLKNDSEDDACGCSWSPELQQEAVGCSINFLKKQGMHPKNADGISSAAFLQASHSAVIHTGESSIGVSILSGKKKKDHFTHW